MTWLVRTGVPWLTRSVGKPTTEVGVSKNSLSSLSSRCSDRDPTQQRVPTSHYFSHTTSRVRVVDTYWTVSRGGSV